MLLCYSAFISIKCHFQNCSHYMASLYLCTCGFILPMLYLYVLLCVSLSQVLSYVSKCLSTFKIIIFSTKCHCFQHYVCFWMSLHIYCNLLSPQRKVSFCDIFSPTDTLFPCRSTCCSCFSGWWTSSLLWGRWLWLEPSLHTIGRLTKTKTSLPCHCCVHSIEHWGVFWWYKNLKFNIIY